LARIAKRITSKTIPGLTVRAFKPVKPFWNYQVIRPLMHNVGVRRDMLENPYCRLLQFVSCGDALRQQPFCRDDV
jgi:hypothetical protein